MWYFTFPDHTYTFANYFDHVEFELANEIHVSQNLVVKKKKNYRGSKFLGLAINL